MQSNSARVLRGLSIAIIVISIIAILANLVMGVATGGLGALAANPDVQASASGSFSADPETQAAMDELGMTEQDAMNLTGGLFVLGGVYLVAVAVLTVFNLIAGIMGLRGGKRPEKAGSAMAWMIVSAIISLFGMNIVLLVLSIIGAVFASKTKKEAFANFAPYGGPQY